MSCHALGMVQKLSDESPGTFGASRVELQVGLSECRTLPVDIYPALPLACRRTCADIRHRYRQGDNQGKDLRPDPCCIWVGVDLTASTAAVRRVLDKIGRVDFRK